MTDEEALMWRVGADPWLDPSGSLLSVPDQPVEIPPNDKNRADPRFRKDLLEAAKQKAPDRYQEAVRKYYEELIR